MSCSARGSLQMSQIQKFQSALQIAKKQKLLIKNGKIVNVDGIVDGDVYIDDGIIQKIGKNLTAPGETRVIDAKGRYVMPGGIDPHTHLEIEFMGTVSADDFYQGTKAAIAGGTTMIIDFAIPKMNESLVEVYNAYRRKADDKVCCDYGLHVCITWWSDQVREEMKQLCEQKGVNSFKMFMTYEFMLNDEQLYDAMETCKELGALAQVHAENGVLVRKNVQKLLAAGITGPEGHEMSRPEEIEGEAVNRACVIAQQVGCPLYVVHVMSKSAALAIKRVQENWRGVWGETLAAALAVDGSQYKNPSFTHAAAHVLSPPLRPDKDTPRALMKFLADGILQVTGSDNCTFTKEQKAMGKNDFSKIPNGVNGLEDRMSIIWERGVHAGVMGPCRFVAVTSTNAARIFNIYPRKGCIAVGSDADLVIWNPNATRTISAETHHHAIDFNIFEGMKCHGVPEYVIVNGRVCVDEGILTMAQNHGRFVETPTHCPFIYNDL